MKYIKKILIFIILSFVICNSDLLINSSPINSYLSDQEYITGEDGIIRMYVNVLGHVNNPGTYLVYDGIDFISLLSLAGGPSRGADLRRITIINDKTYQINFNKFITNGNLDSEIKIVPRTTIYIEEKLGSRLFNGTNLVSSLLQLLNIVVTIERTSD
jgi:hypothetical protein